MQILICLVLISIVQAALVTKIPKTKLNLMHSQHLQSAQIPKHESPEERRKLSLFPKNYMKYVILSEPIYMIAAHKPIVHRSKNPLMKKLNLYDDQNKVVENKSEQPIKTTEPMYQKKIAVIPKVDTVLVSDEISIEVVEDKSEESNEEQMDSSEEEEKLQNVSNENKMVTSDTEDKESPILKDLIYPPIAKPIANSQENKNVLEGFSDVFDNTKNFKEIETADWTEFIFIDPAHKRTESDKISSEQLEEYVTTEFYEEPEIVRRKRGSNVIEEDNLASTVAGYKYTWKDTRLNNDVAFKNIHS